MTGPESIERHRRTFDAVPSAAGAARAFVVMALRAGGVPEGAVADFRLVISELVANIVDHGDRHSFDVCTDVGREGLWVVGIECAAAASDATLPDPAAWSVAGPEVPSGRGLGIVRALMDAVVVTSLGDRLTVECSLHQPVGQTGDTADVQEAQR